MIRLPSLASLIFGSPSLQQDLDPMSFFEALKKINRIRLFEGVLGYCLATLCLVCGFVYLDYALVARGLRFPGQSRTYISLQFNGSLHKPTLDFMGEGGDGCDVFHGDWVWDDHYPLYHSKDCAFLDSGFRCSEDGRPDLFYTKWRWQPKDCNLPRFDAKLMLEKLRNKRVVFAGDSIGRNQWESLLCLLSSAVENKSSIYEVHGSPITKHKGFLVFKFEQYNCTVEYYRSPFLVLQSRAPPGVPKNIGATLKLDQMDWNSVNWRDADMLIFNTGHWWNNEKTIRGGCYFQEGATVNVKMKVEDAYRRSIQTVLHWIHSEVNTSKTQVFFRTYAPVHFRGGNWRSGGNCHRETLPELGSSLVPSSSWEQFRIAGDVLSALSGSVKIDVLNITSMSSRRKDGHSSIYYLGKDAVSAAIRRQDCSHWCLPGVPDSWNELLYALFLKREEATHKSNSSMYRAQA